MLLKFVDRTWILLNRLIEKGNDEGSIKHIEIPLKEWKMLVGEWRDLHKSVQRGYLDNFKVETEEGIVHIRPEIVMDEHFVDQWITECYSVYYKDVKLVLSTPDWDDKTKDKAIAKTELAN